MVRLSSAVAAFGLALACTALAPAAQGAEQTLTYIVPVAAGSADVRPPVPDLLISDGSGMPVHVSRYLGKVVLLNFWSPGTPPCFKELVYLDRLQGNLTGLPLVVVALNEDQAGVPGAKAFLARQKLTFLKPFADPGSAAARTLGVRGLPSTVVIDKHGIVALHVEGAYEWDSPNISKQIQGLTAER